MESVLSNLQLTCSVGSLNISVLFSNQSRNHFCIQTKFHMGILHVLSYKQFEPVTYCDGLSHVPSSQSIKDPVLNVSSFPEPNLTLGLNLVLVWDIVTQVSGNQSRFRMMDPFSSFELLLMFDGGLNVTPVSETCSII
jgi:hypothetical protein